MLSQVERSLKRLGIDRLHAVMLHEPALAVGDMAPVYARAIDRLRASGLVSKVGLSIYSPEILDRLAPVIWPDIVQMPFNVLDQRIRRSGWLTRLHAAGTELHARSVFLQGVLLMTAQDRPLFFSRWPTVFHAWDGLVESTGLTRLELAMGFALSEPNIDRIVVGVHGPSHLEEVLAAARRAPVGQGLAFDVDDDALLDPFRWALPR
jgi:aryl-alcohol dehydrogenase-like predicted oxidoreductase